MFGLKSALLCGQQKGRTLVEFRLVLMHAECLTALCSGKLCGLFCLSMDHILAVLCELL